MVRVKEFERLTGDVMSQGKKTILVVDDDQNIRRSFCRMLELVGFCAMEASSGEDALERLKHEEIALVLMDVVMPGMGGIEAAKMINAGCGSLPVVLMSGYFGGQEDTAAMPCGVRKILSKPIGVRTLLDVIQQEIAAAV